MSIEGWILESSAGDRLSLVAPRVAAVEEATLPEPTSWLLLVTGLAGLGARRWLVRRSQAPANDADRAGETLLEPTPDGGS